MDPSGEGSTFLKVDEVSETSESIDNLDPPSENVSADEFWRNESGQPVDSIDSAGPAPSDPPPRPQLQRDHWVPPPQQPAPSPPGLTEEPDPSNDSITLAQLKKIVGGVPKKEPTPYAFDYQDTASFEEELEELFGYGVIERETLLRLPAVYETSCKKFFAQALTQADPSEEDVEVRHVKFLHENLKGSDPEGRSEALEVLLYMALGCWKDTATQQELEPHADTIEFDSPVDSRYEKRGIQIRKIKDNIGLITRFVGLHPIAQCFRSACLHETADVRRSDDLVGDMDSTRFERQSLVDSNTDFWASAKLLTLLVDFARRSSKKSQNQQTSEETSVTELSLLKFLTRLLADWRWDESGAVPSATLISLYWKLILLTFGGTRDVLDVKKKWSGDRTSSPDDTQPFITASPLEYHLFRQEITSKYPAFDPPQPLFPFEPESNSIFPPLQEQIHKIASENKLASSVPGGITATGPSIIHQPVHISTPAPSPPPSPAGPGGKGIKKQNYQTNQMFPFLYPPLEETSNSIGGKGSTELQDALAGRKWTGSDIPASILEAADLFAQRMRATRAMKQLWDERVRFMKYERGYDPLRLPDPATEESQNKTQESTLEEGAEEDPALKMLDRDQRQKLDTVERFYATEAPYFQSLVVVLLKIMLQTVTSLVTQPNMQNGLHNGTNGTDIPLPQSNGDGKADPDDQSVSILQSLDVMRSQEIMGKAVSGTILLFLKWFKLSHVLKFEYFSQLLLDSNYAQLVLKMSTYQDLERVVNFKCERKSLNFFEFCHRNALGAKITASDEDEEFDAEPPPIRTHRNTNGDSMDEIPASVTRVHPPETEELGTGAPNGPAETITDFSRRNFFSNINHLRILQKIVKHKAHRQLMMVQYKFSNVLKKSLKVPQPDIRLYTLKIIKGQVPYCHRKWRQSNMRIITAIYLHCKPELRDDWLAGLAIEEEMSEALPQEQALRSLTYWYNLRKYPDSMGSDQKKAHGLMEEEQDFFVRELDTMEAAMGSMRMDGSLDGDEGLDFGPRMDGAMQMEGY